MNKKLDPSNLPQKLGNFCASNSCEFKVTASSQSEHGIGQGLSFYTFYRCFNFLNFLVIGEN